MPDDATRRAADSPVTTGEPSSTNAEPTDDDLSAGLSDAARGVIHQATDPRLDAHLARMLSDAPAEARGRDVAASGELARLRSEVETLRTEAEASARYVRTLAWLLIAAIGTIVVLLVLLAIR
jgi:CHASE3 domain sensor protein